MYKATQYVGHSMASVSLWWVISKGFALQTELSFSPVQARSRKYPLWRSSSFQFSFLHTDPDSVLLMFSATASFIHFCLIHRGDTPSASNTSMQLPLSNQCFFSCFSVWLSPFSSVSISFISCIFSCTTVCDCFPPYKGQLLPMLLGGLPPELNPNSHTWFTLQLGNLECLSICTSEVLTSHLDQFYSFW